MSKPDIRDMLDHLAGAAPPGKQREMERCLKADPPLAQRLENLRDGIVAAIEQNDDVMAMVQDAHARRGFGRRGPGGGGTAIACGAESKQAATLAEPPADAPWVLPIEPFRDRGPTKADATHAWAAKTTAEQPAADDRVVDFDPKSKVLFLQCAVERLPTRVGRLRLIDRASGAVRAERTVTFERREHTSVAVWIAAVELADWDAQYGPAIAENTLYFDVIG